MDMDGVDEGGSIVWMTGNIGSVSLHGYVITSCFFANFFVSSNFSHINL